MRSLRSYHLLVGIALLAAACSSVKSLGAPDMPSTADLHELFQAREVAMANATLLKARMGPSIPENEIRTRYLNVQSAF